MPPRAKTTTTTSGQTTPPQIVELPPTRPTTPPPNPSTSSNVDSDSGPPTADLAAAISALAQSLSSPKKSPTRTKVRKPDVFDGTDTRKLQPFLVLCTLNFRDRPDAFSSDSAKVTFALSYLKGTALDWFEPSLTSGESPPWLDDYSEFIAELKNNFGPHDPEGEAEAELENLRMRDNQHIVKYLVDFNRLAARVQWGDSALRRQFYRGLPSRIKDEIARVGKPDSLTHLRTLSQSINSRYWERRSEVARETPPTSKPERSNDKGKGNPNNNPAPNADKNKNNSGGKSNNSGSGNSGSSSSNQKKPASDLSSKLGKDGKLTQQERQRRFEQNLCLFCGRTGHVAKECPKSTSSASKARSATATDKNSDAKAGTESKNS